MTGAPCWIDLLTSDVARAREFYGELFGWTSEEAGAEYGGYVSFAKDGRGVAGCMANTPETGSPDTWSVYLETADAAATADAAVAAGGKVIVPPMPVTDLGVMLFLTDAGGAAIGAWQPGRHTGFGIVREPGSPGWFELHTRDYEASVRFYREVFAWDTHTAGDTPEFRYTTLGEGEAAQAGVMDASAFLPEGVPAHWSIYFAVDSTDETLARAEALGGRVVQPAETTPYGRLAQAADPTGALFKLIARV
ncbi:MAG TPA: VOC family protein [Acidimicrobiales bacterium]|jgi:hypothetical protein